MPKIAPYNPAVAGAMGVPPVEAKRHGIGRPLFARRIASRCRPIVRNNKQVVGSF